MRVRWLAAFGCLLGVSALTAMGCGGGGGGGGGATKEISGTKLTVYSSLPEQGGNAGQAKAIEQGAKLAVSQRGGKVGKYTVVYKPLDDSLASTGSADEGKGAQNARTAVQDKTTIGYLGEYNSGISKVTIPILNKAGITQISPANTYVGLTSDAPGHDPGEPQKYYPTGKRTYARVVPKDTVQAAAMVTGAKQEGCKTIDVYNDKTTYSAGLARNIAMVAPKIGGVKVETNEAYDPKAANYRSLVAGNKADCLVTSAEIDQNGVQLMKDYNNANPNAKLYAGDALCLNVSADPEKGVPSSLAPKFKCTIATLDPKTFGASGKKFFSDFSKTYHEPHPDPYSIYGYESMALLLDSIDKAAKSGKLTRQAVTNAVLSTKNRPSVLGTYSINKDGDSSITDYGLYKIVGKVLTFDKVLKPDQSLLSG